MVALTRFCFHVDHRCDLSLYAPHLGRRLHLGDRWSGWINPGPDLGDPIFYTSPNGLRYFGGLLFGRNFTN